MPPTFSAEILIPLEDLSDCHGCPRDCGAGRDRGHLGYCRSGPGFEIASIVAHLGEEPVISGKRGICNLFFTHCNMQCLYCQNHQISRNDRMYPEHEIGLEDVLARIDDILDTGVRVVGFVSPSHCIPQMKVITRALEATGRRPVYVFNTNGYDQVETLASLEDTIDVFLPDLKYMDDDLAGRYSDTPDYPRVAARALREMYRQKGSDIRIGADGIVESGLIVRHLILPGQVENSKECLRFIARELTPSVHVSLMAQYYPPAPVSGHAELGRPVTEEEYEEVKREFERLGFYRGWIQEMESRECYRPDFDRDGVFRM